jgi:chemotaxis protein CheD
MLMRRARAGSGDSGATRLETGPPRVEIYLHAGQVVASAEPKVVMTILGSCVAVCIWDPVTGIGGMNHFVLPECAATLRSDRFGNIAIQSLLRRLEALGCRRRSLQAKVFGGARVLGRSDRARVDLGQTNVELALRVLATEKTPVVASDVGGDRGRKLIFRTADGAAWVKRIERFPDGDG